MQQLLLRFEVYFMVVIATLIIALMFFISYFGAPVTDESFPIATTLRFIQGQRPFVDDYSPYIPIALLLMPIIKLSMWVHHGKNELILFLRHAYLIFSMMIAGYTFFLTRKIFSNLVAFFVAMSLFIFHAFGINNFHYDTLSVLLWTSLLFQFLFLFEQKQVKKYQYLFFSLTNLLLVFSYPTFIFFLILFYIIYSPFFKNAKEIWQYHSLCALIAFTALVFLFVHWNISYADVSKTMAFSHRLFQLSSHDGTILTKFSIVIKNLFNQYKIYVLISLTITLVARYIFKNPLISITSLAFNLILPIFFIDLSTSYYVQIFYFFNCIGLCGSFLFYLFLKNDSTSKKLFYLIWIPAFAAGMMTSTTSYNLELNFIIGFFPASITSTIFLLTIIKQSTSIKMSYMYSPMITIYMLLMLCFFQFNYIYDATTFGREIYSISKPYRISGPFAGLFIEPRCSSLLEQMQSDIKLLEQTPHYFVYFGTMASGYLLVDHLKPGDYLLYCPYQLAHFGQGIKIPSYIFDFSKILGLKKDLINPYLATNASKILSNERYDVYKITS